MRPELIHTASRLRPLACACMLGLGGLLAWGQQAPTPTPAPSASTPAPAPSAPASAGRVLNLSSPDSGTSALGPSSATGSLKGDTVAIPAEIKAQLQQFQSARDAYLKKQKELMQQLKGSGDEQRRAVREQLQVLRQEWLDRSLAFRREVSDRLPPDLRGFGVLDSKAASAAEVRRNNRNLK